MSHLWNRIPPPVVRCRVCNPSARTQAFCWPHARLLAWAWRRVDEVFEPTE